IGLVASLTLAPVLLSMLRGAVFWPFRPPHHEEGADVERESLEETPMYGLWAAVANLVVSYPATILIASLLVLAPFAYLGTQTHSSYDLLADLSPTEPSVAGSRVFQNYYPKGELGPSTILVRDRSIDFSSEVGREKIADLSRELAKLPNVVEVRSLTRPLGKPGQYAPPKPGEAPASKPEEPKPPKSVAQGGFFGQISGAIRQSVQGAQEGVNTARQELIAFQQRQIREGILAHYVSTQPKDQADRNHITRLDVVFGSNPFSEESLESLDRVEGILAEVVVNDVMSEDAEIGISGTTVQIDDLKKVTTLDERRMYLLVTLGVYAILVVLLGRPGICLYLIATVVLGYLASLGMTELVFRDILHTSDPWTGLDWKVGFFLFVILVAVGEDYNIFLMSRLIEEERKHGPIEGTRRAVAHTGGIISSCGVIMAGTFMSMLFGSLTALRELGFALGLGVLLDTFIVRPILVPAFVVLWHRMKPDANLDSTAVPHDRPERAATTSRI
ncbi:MAG TPA: MMPL family transporter, partial [Isosphaeraceae bacterium]|nr:MMPL family transporter [Isosphaeraceae bacterium]